MNPRIKNNELRWMKAPLAFDIRDSLFGLRYSSDPRSGSALLIVLGVMAVLSVLVAGFGRGLRADLRATDGSYQAARNEQLARSALAAARLELSKPGASMYADAAGTVYFVTEDASYESEIESLAPYRKGLPLGRGYFSYRFVMKPYALDINNLSPAAWGRLFEAACGLEDDELRSSLVDSILDWIDTDTIQRAFGAEEEFYLSLDPPRRCRNGFFETVEELLLVNGMTPDLLYGYGHPVYVENGLLLGGGLYRFLIGDNSPEGEATAQYIRRGVLPADDQRSVSAEADRELFQKVAVLPPVLYLIAEGFASLAETEDGQSPYSVQEEIGRSERSSRHSILVTLKLPEGTGSIKYTISDFQGDATGELLNEIVAYGIPEENHEL